MSCCHLNVILLSTIYLQQWDMLMFHIVSTAPFMTCMSCLLSQTNFSAPLSFVCQPTLRKIKFPCLSFIHHHLELPRILVQEPTLVGATMFIYYCDEHERVKEKWLSFFFLPLCGRGGEISKGRTVLHNLILRNKRCW